MNGVVNGFQALQPLAAEMKAKALADAINELLCPELPAHKGAKLRLGIDKRGNHVVFKLTGSDPRDPKSWQRAGEYPNSLLQRFFLCLNDPAYEKTIVPRQGPAACLMYYYEPERHPEVSS